MFGMPIYFVHNVALVATLENNRGYVMFGQQMRTNGLHPPRKLTLSRHNKS